MDCRGQGRCWRLASSTARRRARWKIGQEELSRWTDRALVLLGYGEKEGEVKEHGDFGFAGGDAISHIWGAGMSGWRQVRSLDSVTTVGRTNQGFVPQDLEQVGVILGRNHV